MYAYHIWWIFGMSRYALSSLRRTAKKHGQIAFANKSTVPNNTLVCFISKDNIISIYFVQFPQLNYFANPSELIVIIQAIFDRETKRKQRFLIKYSDSQLWVTLHYFLGIGPQFNPTLTVPSNWSLSYYILLTF